MISINNLILAINLDFLQPIVDVLNVILIPFIALIATAGTIYAIVLGVNMAKSDTAEKREVAKKRITGVVVTMIIVIVLIVALKFILQYLPSWVKGDTSAIINLF